MLLAEPLQRQVKFLIPTRSSIDPRDSKTVIAAAAAEILHRPEEDVDEKVGV